MSEREPNTINSGLNFLFFFALVSNSNTTALSILSQGPTWISDWDPLLGDIIFGTHFMPERRFSLKGKKKLNSLLCSVHNICKRKLKEKHPYLSAAQHSFWHSWRLCYGSLRIKPSRSLSGLPSWEKCINITIGVNYLSISCWLKDQHSQGSSKSVYQPFTDCWARNDHNGPGCAAWTIT